MPFYELALNYVSLQNLLCDGVPFREKGSYDFKCFETMRGIPILSSIGKGNNPKTPFVELSIISEDSYEFRSQLYRETELLIEDVPLLSFEKVLPTFEKIINDGLLKDVYFMRLGYIAVYEKGKTDDEVYRLLPCWVLTGEYYDSAKDEANWAKQKESGELDEISIMSRGYSRNIIVNAQTGKIIPQEASNKENQKLFNVKTW